MTLVVGGDDSDEVKGGEGKEAVPSSRGRGAIGIATSTVRLYAGYPSHCLPDLTHLMHCGLVSSHFTLRFLQRVLASAH
jgi:hypothetical protein